LQSQRSDEIDARFEIVGIFSNSKTHSRRDAKCGHCRMVFATPMLANNQSFSLIFIFFFFFFFFFFKTTFDEYNLILDPHTAVAQHVAQQQQKNDGVPMVLFSTAHWGKFSQSVGKAIFKSNFSENMPIEKQWNLIENEQNLVPQSLRNLLSNNTNRMKHNIVAADETKLLASINSFLKHV
jgi:hypothetical protein